MLERVRLRSLKLNPLKFGFRVSIRNFLGFFVYKKGVEIDSGKTKAILEAKPPQTKKELQRFLR